MAFALLKVAPVVSAKSSVTTQRSMAARPISATRRLANPAPWVAHAVGQGIGAGGFGAPERHVDEVAVALGAAVGEDPPMQSSERGLHLPLAKRVSKVGREQLHDVLELRPGQAGNDLVGGHEPPSRRARQTRVFQPGPCSYTAPTTREEAAMATRKSKPGSAPEKTSPAVATKASSQLRSGATNAGTKSVAGSAMAQAKTAKVTSPGVATKASQKLSSPSTGTRGKAVAASVLTQAPNRKPAKRAAKKR